MKKILKLIVTIALLSSLFAFTGCTASSSSQPDSSSEDVQWSSELYAGQETYGVSEELSKALKKEYKKALKAGKVNLFLDALLGFGKVSKSENYSVDGESVQVIYLFLNKGDLILPDDKKKVIDYYQPLILKNNAKIFLNGKPASIDDIKPGDLVSYWGVNMTYGPELFDPPDIINVTLIIAISPDTLKNKKE